jgi:hypothetical protein
MYRGKWYIRLRMSLRLGNYYLWNRIDNSWNLILNRNFKGRCCIHMY